MVKTLRFHCGVEVGSVPSWGTKIPHTVQCSQKFKKKKKKMEERQERRIRERRVMKMLYGRLAVGAGGV